MGLTGINSKFKTSKLHFFEFDFELDSFEEFLDLSNEHIEKKLKKFIQESNRVHDLGDTYFFNGEDVYIKHKSLELYYSSIIISLYSFLEKSLQTLCRITENNHLMKIDDISGSGIFKFKKYLEKVIEIDFEKINYEWNEITKLNHLRNLFVHSSNSKLLKTESKKRINSIKELNLKLREHSDFYIIEFENDELIRHYIKIIRNFLRKIYTNPSSHQRTEAKNK